MIEVEVKAKIENINSCISTFLENGFVKEKYVEELDTYYTSKFHDFKANDEALRLRESKNLISGKKEAFITYKGKKLDTVSMARKEIESAVEIADAIKEILESIGFEPVQPLEKTRVSLTKGNITVCIDDVKGLGGFVEVEMLVKDESMREEALMDIEAVLGTIGLGMKDTVRKSYLSMLEDI